MLSSPHGSSPVAADLETRGAVGDLVKGLTDLVTASIPKIISDVGAVVGVKSADGDNEQDAKSMNMADADAANPTQSYSSAATHAPRDESSADPSSTSSLSPDTTSASNSLSPSQSATNTPRAPPNTPVTDEHHQLSPVAADGEHATGVPPLPAGAHSPPADAPSLPADAPPPPADAPPPPAGVPPLPNLPVPVNDTLRVSPAAGSS
jgi:hypothetical protein